MHQTEQLRPGQHADHQVACDEREVELRLEEARYNLRRDDDEEEAAHPVPPELPPPRGERGR